MPMVHTFVSKGMKFGPLETRIPLSLFKGLCKIARDFNERTP